MDYDKVLVMDAGGVAEFDSPVKLAANPNSQFSALLAHSQAEPDHSSFY